MLTSCYQLSAMEILCRYCKSSCKKCGRQSNGKQKYRCLSCGKYQQAAYSYPACSENYQLQLMTLTKEGCGIRSTSRILGISVPTVLRYIQNAASKLFAPVPNPGGRYEIDELKTYIQTKKRECWITYALCRDTKKVVAFVGGRRTKVNIRKVVRCLLAHDAKSIATDRLNIYPKLIPKKLHQIGRYRTNRIERMNLNLRTHLKRLCRKTICFSRNITMLESCLRIYFWS